MVLRQRGLLCQLHRASQSWQIRGPKQQPFFDDSEACIQLYAILRPSVPSIMQGNKAKIANVKPMGFEADDTEDQREIYVDFVIAKSH